MLCLFTLIASVSCKTGGVLFYNTGCYFPNCKRLQHLMLLCSSSVNFSLNCLLGNFWDHKEATVSPTPHHSPTAQYRLFIFKITQMVSRQFRTISIATRVDCGTCCRRLRFVVTMLWSCISLDVTVDVDEGQIVQLQTETQTAANRVFLTQPGFLFFFVLNGAPDFFFLRQFFPSLIQTGDNNALS